MRFRSCMIMLTVSISSTPKFQSFFAFAQELSVDIVAERIFEEMSAAGTAHALPLNFRNVPEVRSLAQFLNPT